MLGVVDRIGLAGGRADVTIAADTALEAALRLGDRLPWRVANVNFVEALAPGRRVE
jgi:hypothetical protein